MRRTSLVLVIALVATVPSGSTWALQAGDTMAAWKNASTEQKRKLLAQIMKRDASSDLIRCLDAASDVPGHAELPIGDVAKACDANSGEPV